MKFEEAIESIDCSKVMHAVCYRYKNKLSKDDAKSLKLQTLWECCKKYNPDHPKKTKFTSYLYQQLDFKIKNLLKKNRREKTGFVPESIYMPQDFEFEILNSLTEDEKRILTQSYLHKMTIEEIGRANGYSRETARRKLKKTTAKCRELINEA